ncbi:TPA: LuxR C-terminal-related transcriptional regulator, partial [Raoultella planticola]
TQRELIIFDLISSEYDCKKISSILDVNFKTVYSHRLKIVSKLKLKNTHDLYNFMVKLKADDELNFE